MELITNGMLFLKFNIKFVMKPGGSPQETPTSDINSEETLKYKDSVFSAETGNF